MDDNVQAKVYSRQQRNNKIMSNIEVEELGGSELGTKDYWEKSYDSEIRNYKSHGDVGEVWFDEDSQLRVINWMLRKEIASDVSIIDLGCGNGMMLIELAREGYTNLTGVDYSPKAIELSRNIAKDQNIAVTYKVIDLLQKQLDLGRFQIVHDKGTYDAISLHPDDPKAKRGSYIRHVHEMLEDNGSLIITSCNWTEEELIAAFDGYFIKSAVIPSPSFMFGGKVGSVVTSLVFQKVLTSST